MLPIADALARILPLFPVLSGEQVSLIEARGRVLVEGIAARLALPGFDNSAMDGYAVRFADVDKPGATLPLCGEVPAGATEVMPLPAGQACRIFTGAPMPSGADTVVMQEDAVPTDKSVRFEQAPKAKGSHVRRCGSDVAPGTALLTEGTLLGPGELSLLATQGISTCTVVRRPRVAIVSTGSELVEIHEADRPFTVVNSNAYTLSAMVLEACGEPVVLPIARDDLSVIKDRIRAAMAADVVVCSGGVSVGDHDLVARAFDELGVQTEFWKVAVKPGKPLRVGSYEGKPVIGLPGNPVSAMITFELFVRPGLLQMAGRKDLLRPALEATLERAYARKPGRTEFARGRLIPGTPLPSVRLFEDQGSSAMRSMVGVDVLAVLPRGRGAFEAGERVTVLAMNPAVLTTQAEHPLRRADT